jgi:transglutaminase-like putative cysteine protease
MRFGLVHRVMTDALAVLGVLAVVSTASLSPWTNIVLLVGLAGAIVVPEGWQGRPALRHFATVAPLALLIVQAGRLVAGRSPLDVAVEFAALLQIVRLATRRGAAHDQQIIVLALLHFVAGTVLGGGLTYGICFLGFLVVAPGALVLSHLRREVEGNYRQGARDRTGLPVDVPRILRSRRVVGRGFLGATCLLSLPILLFTIILFLLFPRIGLSLLLLSHPHAGRMIGFSEHVDLGEVGVLRDDPTVALRFELRDVHEATPTRLTLRLRGTAFDTYDGHAWLRTQRDPVHYGERNPDGGYVLSLYPGHAPARERVISFDLEPIDPPVLFLPPRAMTLRVPAPSGSLLGEPLTIQRGPEDELRYAGADSRGLRYDVAVARPDEDLTEALAGVDRQRYLAVPLDLPSRIADLAHKWTDGIATSEAKAAAIENHLRHDYGYDLHSPSSGKPQPVDHFLFESRRGHCEFFSTAMALMLRTLGIPSRNVTGFVGGTWNRFGHYYAVRQGDAHSWVEAYLDDPVHPSWRTFDPTPVLGAQPLEPPGGVYYYLRDFVEALSQRWTTYVVGYDLHRQISLFDDVTRRYEQLRSRAGVDKGILDKLTRAPAVGASSLALVGAAYWFWKRRRQRGESAALRSSKRGGLDAQVESAVALFRALESALHTQGITRPPSLPPLRHAQDLCLRNHPLGEEVVSLTERYLAARFGGEVLDETDRHDFERRVRDIRATPARRASSRFAGL